MHARALGAAAERVETPAELEDALRRARASANSTLISIETDPARPTQEGGCWWEVAVPEVSSREAVRAARLVYEQQLLARSARSKD
jgi:3D-(3,5/4)-trihydroxycyclohexane-1,2-dione acylhydrolase (decyclizing)